MKLTKEQIIEAAFKESQASIHKSYTEGCPRYTANPGIYFGFVEGVKWALEMLEKDEDNQRKPEQN